VTPTLWSLTLAAAGLAASRWGALPLALRPTGVGPRAAWLAGLPALLPTWLFSFVSLLGAAGTAQGPPRTAFLGASAAAILGVVASDWLFVREERRPGGGRLATSWLLGAAALAPAWLVALFLATRLAR
jgi:hypothetical protein